MKAIIDVRDSSSAYTNSVGKEAIGDALTYFEVMWRTGPFRKERVEVPVSLLVQTGDNEFMFPAGFVPKVATLMVAKGLKPDYVYQVSTVAFDTPNVPGITFRPDQIRLLETGLEWGRGVLKAFTGAGKTVIAMGLVSAFSQERVLFLCHTTDLIKQTEDEFKKHGFKDIGVWSGQRKTRGRIQLATIQSYANLDVSMLEFAHDVIIVDEAHHASAYESQYGYVLMNCLAPVKLGLTATMPYTSKAQMALEGLIGPLIGEVSIQEGAELGLLAKPKIKILKAPDGAPKGETYQEVYLSGIVYNSERNMLIAKTAKQLVDRGHTVLINIRAIEHGDRILAYAKHIGLDAYFVHGQSAKEDRDDIKKALSDRTISCVIASVVWSEGINIPSLNACINAAGGKSEIKVLQTIGRGLRKTDNKTEVLIVDFQDDGHPFFKKHFRERIALYEQNGWL